MCSRLKNLLYPAHPWVEVHNLVGKELSSLKVQLNIIYSDIDILERLMLLNKFSDDDLLDAIGRERVKFNDGEVL